MTLNLELEIKSLLEKFHEPEVVAQQLLKLYEDQSIERSEEEVRQLCRFLLNCGLHQTLVRFCLHYLPEKDFKMPWVYFIQSLNLGLPDLEEDAVKFIIMGIEEENAAHLVVQAKGAERFVKNAKELRAEQQRLQRRNFNRLKDDLIDEMLTLRTQQLYEQEKILLGKMQRMFPGDLDVREAVREHKERYALDILSRRSPLSRSHTTKEPALAAEIQALLEPLKNSLLDAAQKYPDLAFDFAIAAYMMDAPKASVEILSRIDLPPVQQWFFVEVKLKCRLFLEVLGDLNRIEIALAQEPETFFTAAYLRAQAYWGLQQKHIAIEILENVLAARPNYRSGAALLDIWRSQ